jgi:UDP-GlcNAc:undecaprenyl-phosphate GlcNAc-1-phosphate transferase
VLGALDDAWGVRPAVKLLVEAAVAVGMYVAGYRINAIGNPFGGPIQLGWLGLPVTVFWFLGCMNAINLMDGLDGLAAGVVVFASATLFMTGLLFQNYPAALFAVVLAGSTVGFLILNFPPASLFLGDSGSLLLGFLVACVGMLGAQKSHTVMALLIPVIALGLPIMDTSLAILRRWSKALPVSASDRQHIHHKLLEMGLGHRKAVLAMYGGCLILAAAALLMTAANSLQAAGLLIAIALVTFAAVRFLGRHELGLASRSLKSFVRRRRQRTRSRTAGYVASTRMRHADSVEALWSIFADAARGLALDEAELVVSEPEPGQAADAVRHEWRNPARKAEGAEDDVVWSATYPLSYDGERLGRLRVSKATNGRPLGADIPETLELLGKALSINLSRVWREGREHA